MTESFLKMTENDRDRKWPLSKDQKTIPKAAFAIRCKNRKHLYIYTSVTYELFFNILREKACFQLRIFVSLHRQSKEQSSCAKSRSSMTTEAGLNRWQAPVINEDHKMGRKRLSGELWFKELLTHIAVTRHVTPWFPISSFFEVWFGCSMDFLFPSGLGLM